MKYILHLNLFKFYWIFVIFKEFFMTFIYRLFTSSWRTCFKIKFKKCILFCEYIIVILNHDHYIMRINYENSRKHRYVSLALNFKCHTFQRKFKSTYPFNGTIWMKFKYCKLEKLIRRRNIFTGTVIEKSKYFLLQKHRKYKFMFINVPIPYAT